jgi:hypothetical protein
MQTSGSMPDRDVDSVMPAVVGQRNKSERETGATRYYARMRIGEAATAAKESPFRSFP